MRDYPFMHHSFGGYGFGGGWLALLWMALPALLTIILLAVLFWLLGRSIFGRRHQQPTVAPNAAMGAPGTAGTVSAVEIVRQRYARGEIDGDTFQAMLGQLHASDNASEREDGGGDWRPQSV